MLACIRFFVVKFRILWNNEGEVKGMRKTVSEKEECLKLIRGSREATTEGLENVIINGEDQLVVYDENGLLGVAYYSMEDNGEEMIATLGVFVVPNNRRQGIGRTLFAEMESRVKKRNPDFICVYIEDEELAPFLKTKCYKHWWASPELVYKGGQLPERGLTFVPYNESYFDRYVELVQKAYIGLHKKNDIKPYLATEDIVRSYKLNRADRVYLVLDGEEMVASVTVGDGEVDNVMVEPGHQSKGLGRASLHFAINRMLDEGWSEIRICYVEGNEHAESLYRSVGFKPLNYTMVYRKFLT
ncbi:GNAT family N-acetyltransferase [Rossellomorea marisflavi]|uniref:GNAT family N-acetyltransferase n=1 Tax=Rossellomorea marisflavi TaxID=189381 RepID=A0A5D4RZ23_9BACI|nr:GNAT family N-acetyltransferase [Rossellomorea marisflavi]TYS55108.1 GNAT family N-acetyltransferase [Rossellomorea marisflavi]